MASGSRGNAASPLDLVQADLAEYELEPDAFSGIVSIFMRSCAAASSCCW